MTKTEIKFSTTESKTKLTGGKVCYHGNVIHNQVMSEEATRKAFAEYANMRQPAANLAIDNLCEFIADNVAAGNRLDFGGFSVSLTLRGALPARNANFDAEKNEICVAMKPGKRMLKAVSGLKPVNTADKTNYIHATEQISPKIAEIDTLDAEGTRSVLTVCVCELIAFTDDTCGVWVESDLGVQLCKGEITKFDGSVCKYKLSGSIPKGQHWIVVCGRSNNTKEYIRLKRRVTVK